MKEILKFQVHEVWETRNKDLVYIKEIILGNFPIVIKRLSAEAGEEEYFSLTEEGQEISNKYPSDYDLILQKGVIRDYPESLL